MPNSIHTPAYRIAVIPFLFSLIFQGCALHAADTSGASHAAPLFAHILIYPCQDMAGLFGKDQTVLSPLSGRAFETGAVEAPASDFMTSEVVRLFRRNGTQRFTVYGGDVGYGRDMLEQLIATGRRMESDAVLVSYLFEFIELVGGSYGAEQPARVSFELNLVDTTNGRLVWHQSFQEAQQSLNENLFELGKFIKRKGRWITAREMAAQALEQMLNASVLKKTP